MSISAFKTLLDSKSLRSDRISVLASDTDISTGIIDGASGTACDKAYWEGEGPVGNTGQIYAAVVDILDILHGRVVDQTINFNDKMTINLDGIGIGATPTSSLTLNVAGNTVFAGDMSIVGNETVTGDLSCAGKVSAVNDLLVSSGVVNITESLVAGEIGNERRIASLSAEGDLILEMHPGQWGVERTPINADQFALNFGITNGRGEYRFYMDQEKRTYFQAAANGVAAYTKDELPTTDGIHFLGKGAYSNLHIWSPAASPEIEFNANYDPAVSRVSSVDQSGKIKYSNAGPGLHFMYFTVGPKTPLTLSHEATTVTDVPLVVANSIGSSEDYWFKVDTFAAPNINRDGEQVPAFFIGAGIGTTTKQGRLGFDGNRGVLPLRLWMNGNTLAGSIPAVALGKPLGTHQEPLDGLVQLDSPFMTMINDDLMAVSAANTTKEGLWIGAGNASSTHKGSRVWLRDTASYRSVINWGGVEEPYHMFLKDGVVRTCAGTIDPNIVGKPGGFLGSHKIPSLSTTDDWTSLFDMTMFVEDTVEKADGSTALVYSSSDNASRLAVYSAAEGKWNYFAPSATHAS